VLLLQLEHGVAKALGNDSLLGALLDLEHVRLVQGEFSLVQLLAASLARVHPVGHDPKDWEVVQYRC